MWGVTMKMLDLSHLNQHQNDVVTEEIGPILVYAGPGRNFYFGFRVASDVYERKTKSFSFVKGRIYFRDVPPSQHKCFLDFDNKFVSWRYCFFDSVFCFRLRKWENKNFGGANTIFTDSFSDSSSSIYLFFFYFNTWVFFLSHNAGTNKRLSGAHFAGSL